MDKCKDNTYWCIFKDKNNTCTLDIDTPCKNKVYMDEDKVEVKE